MYSVHNPVAVAHLYYFNSRMPGLRSLTLSNAGAACEGQIMSNQPPPMQSDELGTARGLPSAHMPAAVGLQKRKSNVAVSPILAHPSPRPSQKRRKGNDGPSSTSAPSSRLASRSPRRILARQDAAPPRAQPVPKALRPSWGYQTHPSLALEPRVPDLFPGTDFWHGYFCLCYICMAQDPFYQMAKNPCHALDGIDPSLPLLESPKSCIRRGLEDMPPEILHRVCEYLDEQDVGHFRRTTQKHAAVGDEHMFRRGTLRFDFHPDHFDRLHAIAKNEMICQKIKTLELVGGQHGFFGMLFPSVYRVDNGEYQRLYSRLRFQDSIRHLTKLEAIEMRIDAQQDPRMTTDTCYRLSEQMHFLLSDIQSVPTMNIKYLRMEGVGWQSPCCVGARLSKDGSNLKALEDAAGRLLRLDLTVQPHPQDPGMTQCSPLAHYLHFAPNLEELKLKFGDRGLPRFVDLGEVCRLRWSHLRSVDFKYAKVLQQDLLSFLEAHSDLKELRLGSMVLRRGRWTTAIDRMSQVLPKLEKISFSGTLHDTRLLETRTFLCGNSLTHYAHQAVVKKRRGPATAYPPDPMAVAQALLRRDREAQEQRRAAGLSCDLCRNCGQLEHS